MIKTVSSAYDKHHYYYCSKHQLTVENLLNSAPLFIISYFFLSMTQTFIITHDYHERSLCLFSFWLLPKHFSCEVKYVLTAAQHLIQSACLTCAPVMKVVLFLLSLTVCLESSCVLAKTLEFFIAAVETKWEYVFTDSTDPTANQRWALLL